MPASVNRRAGWIGAAVGLGIMCSAHSGLAQEQDSQDNGAQAGDVGRQLFVGHSCGTCHALADAGGVGSIGPSLDGNSALSADHAAKAITEGQGAMPAFGDQLSDEQIATLAAYIMSAKE